MRGYFDIIIAQEDVARLKPDPECFFRAMEISGADAADTVIFEDSDTGLLAARASGACFMKVYGFGRP